VLCPNSRTTSCLKAAEQRVGDLQQSVDMKHGGDLTGAQARYGTGGPAWLDLSTGINPHPWPIPPAIRNADWTRLPSRADLDGLVAAARRAYGVAPASAIVAAPGTQSLIQWLPRLAAGGGVSIVGPTYVEHADSWREAGFAVEEVADLADARSAHIVIVNPNNPDGRVASLSSLVAAAERCRAAGGWLIVDESFADADPDCSLLASAPGLPAIVLRSFGKFYGLAGMRLGFAVAPPEIAERLARALGPWAVSAPAIAVGTAALGDQDWARSMRSQLERESRALDDALSRAGLRLVGGTSLYRLAQSADAGALHAALAKQHIWVRRFAWQADLLRFGLPPDDAALQRLATGLS
jgi:cobalamin biosynthetic protein CobC